MAALKAAANSDSGRAARTTAALSKDKAKAKAKPITKRPVNDDDDYIPVGKGGKAKYTFGGMVKALADTTRIDEVTGDDDDNEDKQSHASSDLRLSYLDDVPLKTRFPSLKPPASSSTTKVPPAKPLPADKPLTIVLPASGAHKPLRSVTDILRELRTPAKENPPARFGGGAVAYTSSAIQAEADAFATALTESNLPSQPSPPPSLTAAPTGVPPPASDTVAANANATAATPLVTSQTPRVSIPQLPTNQYD